MSSSLNTSRNKDDEKAEIVTLGSQTDSGDSDNYNYQDSDNYNDNNNAISGLSSIAKDRKSSSFKKGGGKSSKSKSDDIEYAWRIQLDLRRVGKHRGNVYNRIRKILNYYGFERYSSNGNGPIYYRNDDIIDHYSNRNDIKDEFIIPTLFSQLMIRKIQTEIDGINQEALKKLIEIEKEKEKEKEKGNGNKGSKNKKNDSKKEEDISRKISENFEKTMLVRYQIFYHGHYGDLSISWTAPIGNHYLKKIENNARDGTACQQNDCHNNNNNNDSSSSSDSDSKPRKKNKDDSSKTKRWKTSMVGGGDYSASDEEALSEESVSDMGSNDEYDSHDDMHPEMSNLKRKNSMCKDNNNSNKNMKSSKNSKKTDINKKENVKNILNTTNQSKKNGDIGDISSNINNNNNELDELSSEFSSATATDNDNDEDDTGVDSVKKQLSFRKRN